MAQSRAEQADAALKELDDPNKRAELAKRPELVEPLNNPRLVPRIEEFRDRKRAEAELRRSALLGPQRWVLIQREENGPKDAEKSPVSIRELVQWGGAPEHTPRGKSKSPWRREGLELFGAMAAILAGFVVSAVVLRGGASILIAGFAIVRADGRRAPRSLCGIRAFIVWLPIAVLLFGAAIVQAVAPERVHLALGLWLLAVALLPVYVVVALRYPVRPPQDRLLGTFLVPE